MSNETDLDWLARNVHVWKSGYDLAVVQRGIEEIYVTWPSACSSGITKKEWLSRRAELQNKPSWSKAEEWAEWLAQDSYGRWGFFQKTPLMHALSWIARSGYYQIHSPCNLLLGDWRDTLERRPEEFKPFTSIEDNQELSMTQQQVKQDNGWFERGELPPVGTECIFEPGDGKCYFNESELRAKGQKVTIIAHTKYKKGDGSVAVFQWDLNDCCGVSSANQNGFRPIRTERDVLLSIIVEEMNRYDTDGKLANAILAAGFSLGAK